MKGSLRIFPQGDSAWVVQFPEAFSFEQHETLIHLVSQLDQERPQSIFDVVPGHTTLLVSFDPSADAQEVRSWMEQAIAKAPGLPHPQRGQAVRVPVCFAPRYALDLQALAEHKQLPLREVIEHFTAHTYRCSVLGFRPGFAYLQGVPPQLQMPRHATPRFRVPAGSVGIAEEQAGVYPVEGPGGWQIVGRTPMRLFDPQRPQAFALQPGDRVQFYAIDEQAFEHAFEHGFDKVRA